MRKFSIVLVVAAVVGVGVLVGVLATKGPKTAPPNPGQEVVLTPGASPPPSPHANPGTATAAIAPEHNPQTQPNPRENGVPTSVAAGNLITNWEDRVDQILTSDGEDADKAKQMLEMMPRLSEEGQIEVAQHLSNLLPDQDYPQLGKYLTDPKLPEDVLDELMADVLNRPNSLKLPYLLQVAKEPGHAKATEAKDLLELFLEEDYGNDWPKWQTKMEEWLKENPD